jgi:hypothetical protein
VHFPAAATDRLQFAVAEEVPVGDVKDSPANGTSATMSIGISEPMGGW